MNLTQLMYDITLANDQGSVVGRLRLDSGARNKPKMTLERLLERNKQTLAELGLSVVPRKTTHSTLNIKGLVEEVAARQLSQAGVEQVLQKHRLPDFELNLAVVDGGKLVTCLASVEAVTEDSPEEHFFYLLALHLRYQLFRQFEEEPPGDDSYLALIGSLEGIVEQFKRLELVVVDLGQYIEPVKGNYLQEYILAEKHGLFSITVDTCGPLLWQRATTTDYFRRRWDEALGVLQQIKKNPAADKLLAQIMLYLKETCLPRVKLEIPKFNPPPAAKELRQVIKKVEQEL